MNDIKLRIEPDGGMDGPLVPSPSPSSLFHAAVVIELYSADDRAIYTEEWARRREELARRLIALWNSHGFISTEGIEANLKPIDQEEMPRGFPAKPNPHKSEPGYVDARQSGPNRAFVVIYKAKKSGHPVKRKYAIVCEAHGEVASEDRLNDAQYMARHPEVFCNECVKDEMEPPIQTPEKSD